MEGGGVAWIADGLRRGEALAGEGREARRGGEVGIGGGGVGGRGGEVSGGGGRSGTGARARRVRKGCAMMVRREAGRRALGNPAPQ